MTIQEEHGKKKIKELTEQLLGELYILQDEADNALGENKKSKSMKKQFDLTFQQVMASFMCAFVKDENYIDFIKGVQYYVRKNTVKIKDK